jgi:chemotaxis signal transduction protein
LGKAELPTPHGIVLKDCPRKTVLLVPRIDTDVDIPEDGIHPLPELIGALMPYMDGAYFSGNPRRTMILLFNPDSLLEKIKESQ